MTVAVDVHGTSLNEVSTLASMVAGGTVISFVFGKTRAYPHSLWRLHHLR